MRYELTFHVDAPTPAQVRDLGDAFREALRKSQAKGVGAGDDRLPYLDCRIDHITIMLAGQGDHART